LKRYKTMCERAKEYDKYPKPISLGNCAA